MDWHARLRTTIAGLRQSGAGWGKRAPARQLILFYNRPWIPIPTELPGCAACCDFTTDQGRFEEADAVVFHIPSLYVPPQLPKQPGQRWIALSMESDINYPRLNEPEFMRQFDLTMTYRLDSDVPAPYFDAQLLDALRTPPQAKTETAPAVFMASNEHDRSGRIELVRELMNHLAVDSYGKVLNNRTLAEDSGRQTKLDTISRYKFTLAFENSISPDYVTEKFFDPLTVGSVPVYLGAPNIAEFAPADKSFINVADFRQPRELAEYLRYLDQNDDQYREYLAWKEGGLSEQFTALIERYRVDPFCRLCMRLGGAR